MAVQMHSVVAGGEDHAEAVAELDRRLAETFPAGSSPDLAFVFYSHAHDDAAVLDCLARRLPGTRLIGGVSGHGLVDEHGLNSEAPIGLIAVTDADGAYGVGSAPFGDDPAAAAEQALTAALEDADAVGELPELIWIYQSPGCEEVVLAGLKRLVGDRCPIVGGTAVDDELRGDWRLLSHDGVLVDGVVVAALFPSGGVGVAFQGGYEPVGLSGVVTAVGESRRGASNPSLSDVILTIDGRPAAEVYDEWRGGMLSAHWRVHGQDIDRMTTNDPLGIAIEAPGGITYFRLIQPRAVGTDGCLRTYAAVRVGERVHVMRGSQDGLVRRAAAVVTSAAVAARSGGQEVAGGIVVYCVGCRLAVGTEIGRVVDALDAGFAGRPFVGCFTGGEQGPMLGKAIHANLMISAVVFGT